MSPDHHQHNRHEKSLKLILINFTVPPILRNQDNCQQTILHPCRQLLQGYLPTSEKDGLSLRKNLKRQHLYNQSDFKEMLMAPIK